MATQLVLIATVSRVFDSREAIGQNSPSFRENPRLKLGGALQTQKRRKHRQPEVKASALGVRDYR
jgi:hypothetical protein